MGWLLFLVIAGVLIWALTRPSKSSSRRDADRTWTPPQQSPSSRGDSWEGSFWEVREAAKIQRTVRLRYVDANGEQTRRDVVIRSFEPSNPTGLIIGHCKLRDATRTFRYDRIRECVDLETGEIVADLRAHLQQLRAGTPEGLADGLVSKHWDLLRIMLFVAKADGQMRAAEVAVIAEHCRSITGDESFTPESVKEAMRSVDVMNSRGFVIACNKLAAADHPRLERCFAAAQAIVGTQKTVHPEERAALELMERALGRSSVATPA